jgi:hypothetical protein
MLFQLLKASFFARCRRGHPQRRRNHPLLWKKEERKAPYPADSVNKRLFVFVSNHFEMRAEQIALIYKVGWKIELCRLPDNSNCRIRTFID